MEKFLIYYENNKNVLDYYDVSKKTMALLSVAHMDFSTIVIEENRILFVRQTTTQIIKAACMNGGAEYDGRRKSMSYLIGCKQKVPMAIIPHEGIYAFPTISPTCYECNWIFFHHVKYITTYTPKDSAAKSMIVFKNGQEITLSESTYVLEKQMQRTAMCIISLTGRLDKYKQ
ncbi:competence protein ComK [Bacillus sp. Marseille-P3661]|uniref:competence protein ComK n=1 Tax=Bacillus sp. Marseille-P3661 TaxID=1936234 RepID=UPI000C841B2A|nr:competence protein ComK [Bacillus sp. Marseille-P3661]